MNILIAGAWPYANGSLHIGHLAALLPGDVLARYFRAKGNTVYYVSGSDCHGTPVAIRAKQEDKTPEEISEFYHQEFSECFTKLGFSYDLYGKTTSKQHKDFIHDFHKTMYQSPYIYQKSVPQAYCDHCNQFLADRFVIGKCPKCGADARGDQCDACGTVLDPETLVDPKCSICGRTPEFRESNQLYLAISKLGKELNNFVDSHPNWRKNAISFSRRYIDEGLRDRAVTRDLSWGIDVPKTGFENKKVYIWAENVLGYLSMSYTVAKERGQSFEALWGKDAKHYYVHGKDNIPFHSIILPSLLLAHGGGWHLPDEIISSEYLTLEGRKISTSQNWAIWVKDIVDRYNPDAIRYFFIANGPEKRDTDFSWHEFINSNNGELVGAYGNFVNRTLAFVAKYFNHSVPEGQLDHSVLVKIETAYDEIGRKIEKGELKAAIDLAFELVRFGNKYFDTERPWTTRLEEPLQCQNTIFNCVQLIANLSSLLNPFLPFSSGKIQKTLKVSDGWKPHFIKAGLSIHDPEILFERIDKSVEQTEISRIGQ